MISWLFFVGIRGEMADLLKQRQFCFVASFKPFTVINALAIKPSCYQNATKISSRSSLCYGNAVQWAQLLEVCWNLEMKEDEQREKSSGCKIHDPNPSVLIIFHPQYTCKTIMMTTAHLFEPCMWEMTLLIPWYFIYTQNIVKMKTFHYGVFHRDIL